MDRIRLCNNVRYPVKQIAVSKDYVRITFGKNVYPKTIPKNIFAEIKVEDRRGRLLNRLKGYDTVIQVTDHMIILQKIVYTDAQIAQQANTDTDLEVIEAQQSMTDADSDALESQQHITDADMDDVEAQQNMADVDISQIEQAQITTEMELELLLGV